MAVWLMISIRKSHRPWVPVFVQLSHSLAKSPSQSLGSQAPRPELIEGSMRQGGSISSILHARSVTESTAE